MENHGVGVNMTLTDDNLEECCPAWKICADVLFPPDHYLHLGFLGQGVHKAMVDLGSVLGYSLFLIDVSFGVGPDLV